MSHRIRFLYQALTILLAASVIALGGCSREPAKGQTALGVLRQVGACYRTYFDADPPASRRSLEEAAEILEGATTLEPEGRANEMTLVYCRLYAFDKRNGDSARAEHDLVLMRYWHLKGLELRHYRPEYAMEQLREDDAAHILDYVDRTDRRLNKDHLPRYISNLTNINGIGH